MNSLKTQSNFAFTQMHLARNSSLRKSNEWLQQQLESQNSRVILLYKGQILFEGEQLFCRSYSFVSNMYMETKSALLKLSNFIFLGTELQQSFFALDISRLDIDKFFKRNVNVTSSEQSLTLSLVLRELRASLLFVTPCQAAMLGYANSLSYWHRVNRFCGLCGHETQRLHGGHTVKCGSEACNKEVFPRTDPVVIMLIEHVTENGTPMCLLAEHHRTPEKVVSTLAGFVDPAETLEQAVIREVKEEAGVDVHNVQYIASQPWPFPSSLMLGFYGQANDKTIVIDDDEIRDAKWFTVEEVKRFDNWGDESENYKLPRKESIARHLIDSWVDKNSEC